MVVWLHAKGFEAVEAYKHHALVIARENTVKNDGRYSSVEICQVIDAKDLLLRRPCVAITK